MTSLSETAGPIAEAWERFRGSRDPRARSQLIEHYQPLARIIAAKLYGSRVDQLLSFDDYLQYAHVGLMEAVDRYDHGRGVSFETYSTHRIRGSVLNGVARESERAAQRDFWRTRIPDRIESIAPGARTSPERASLRDLIDITVGIALGLVLDEAEGDPIDETPQANPYAAAELAQLARLLRSLVERLPEREREIIHGHYFAMLEFQSMAEGYRLTKGRVSQLHKRALDRLREMLGEQPGVDRKL